MKIILINPPSSYESYVPPPGISYISAVLKRNNHQVLGIDAASPRQKFSIDEIEKMVKEFSPDMIGVSLNLYFTQGGYQLSERLSKLRIPLVAGGPHIKACPEEALRHNYDIVINGEGEETIVEVIDYLEGKRSIDQINGISYKDDGGNIIRNPDRGLIPDLDTVPFMDRKLFDINNYKDTSGGFFWYPVFSSRGCPFQCTFCCVSTRKIRQRSPENVCDEIEFLRRDLGVTHIAFMDDIFTANKKWLFTFLNEIKARSITIAWNCESRVDTVDEEMLIKMKAGGCSGLLLGVESADPETLTNIKKRNTLEDIERALSLIAKIGFQMVKLNFIFGFPWEKKAHIINSTRLIKKYSKRLRIIHGIVIPIPYPGTELYNAYKDAYSFTDWWLKEKSFGAPLKKSLPYFQRNTLLFDDHWFDKNFFKYSKDFKRFLRKMLLKNRIVAYTSNYGHFSTYRILLLSYISLILFKVNPSLEGHAFTVLHAFRRFLKKMPRRND